MTTLYVIGGGGRTLYVGVTDNWGQRMAQHTKLQPWWPEVEWIQRVAEFPTRAEALQAESERIRLDQPVYNRKGKGALPKPVKHHYKAVRLEQVISHRLPTPLVDAHMEIMRELGYTSKSEYWRAVVIAGLEANEAACAAGLPPVWGDTQEPPAPRPRGFTPYLKTERTKK